MDPQIRELLEKNLAIAEDTNRMVHKLRRNIWWGRLWTILWWVGIFAISGAAYYYYFQPYYEQLIRLYQEVAKGGTQAQSASQQLSSFFGNFLPKQ